MVEILACTVEYIAGFGAAAELLMGVVSCCFVDVGGRSVESLGKSVYLVGHLQYL